MSLFPGGGRGNGTNDLYRNSSCPPERPQRAAADTPARHRPANLELGACKL